MKCCILESNAYYDCMHSERKKKKKNYLVSTVLNGNGQLTT